MYIGSEFKKWDLHVHTPASYYQEYGKDQNAWDCFIEALENIEDMSAIGITDYFSIEGYRKIFEARATGRLSNIELILPNIEFRVSDIQGPKNRKLNYHIIFSDELSCDDINDHFLKSLKFEADPPEKKLSLSKENLVSYGAKLKQLQEYDEDDYYVGCVNATVKLEDIRNILEKEAADIFKGKYILILPEETWCALSWKGGNYALKKKLFMQADAMFSSNPSTITFALGENAQYNEVDPIIRTG